MGKHPNLYNFISVLNDKFQVFINNDSTASVVRASGVNTPNTKNAWMLGLSNADLPTTHWWVSLSEYSGVICDDDN